MMAVRGLDQPAEDRLVADDLGVELEVGRGGHRVHQLGEVLQAAGGLELAPAEQLVAQRDVVDDHPPLGERQHRAEEPAVAPPGRTWCRRPAPRRGAPRPGRAASPPSTACSASWLQGAERPT